MVPWLHSPHAFPARAVGCALRKCALRVALDAIMNGAVRVPLHALLALPPKLMRGWSVSDLGSLWTEGQELNLSLGLQVSPVRWIRDLLLVLAQQLADGYWVGWVMHGVCRVRVRET
jgi:hypothetical protein